MYLHLRVTHLDHAGRPIDTVALDKDEGWIAAHVVQPRSKGVDMFVGGRTISWGDVQAIRVTTTDKSGAELLPRIRAREANALLALGTPDEWHVAREGRDVTEDFIVGLPGQNSSDGREVEDPSSVMVVYGQDRIATRSLFDWLRSVGLRPREWPELVKRTQQGSPYIGDVLDQAFREAQAVVLLFTPDERVQLRGDLAEGNNAPRHQARPNVFLEAGIAFATHRSRTVMVVLGDQEIPSDLAGRHYVRISDQASLRDLASRLANAGCPVDLDGTDWLDLSRFPTRDDLEVDSVASDPVEDGSQSAYSELLAAHGSLLNAYSGHSISVVAVRRARQRFDDAHSNVVVRGSAEARSAAEALRVAWTPRVKGLYMGPGDWLDLVEDARKRLVEAMPEGA